MRSTSSVSNDSLVSTHRTLYRATTGDNGRSLPKRQKVMSLNVSPLSDVVWDSSCDQSSAIVFALTKIGIMSWFDIGWSAENATNRVHLNIQMPGPRPHYLSKLIPRLIGGSVKRKGKFCNFRFCLAIEWLGPSTENGMWQLIVWPWLYACWARESSLGHILWRIYWICKWTPERKFNTPFVLTSRRKRLLCKTARRPRLQPQISHGKYNQDTPKIAPKLCSCGNHVDLTLKRYRIFTCETSYTMNYTG